jgi:hypothetical protein
MFEHSGRVFGGFPLGMAVSRRSVDGTFWGMPGMTLIEFD